MRIADNWSDYQILDASDGEKLESWNGITLIRPDPQIIWKSPKNNQLWEKADARYIRSDKGGGKWQFNRNLPESWTIRYKHLTMQARPTDFKHTGIFPEQAVNWDFCRRKIENSSRRIAVLNLFAYTGAATLACASAGASVCHVDASKGMVAVAKHNAQISGLENANIRYIVDDCTKFVEREIRRSKKYDAVILDPPSYGRGNNGEIWKLAEHIYDLLLKIKLILHEKPLFLLLNSYSTGLSPSVMEYMIAQIFSDRSNLSVTSDEIGLPVKSTGLVLPCGNTAILEYI